MKSPVIGTDDNAREVIGFVRGNDDDCSLKIFKQQSEKKKRIYTKKKAYTHTHTCLRSTHYNNYI